MYRVNQRLVSCKDYRESIENKKNYHLLVGTSSSATEFIIHHFNSYRIFCCKSVFISQ